MIHCAASIDNTTWLRPSLLLARSELVLSWRFSPHTRFECLRNYGRTHFPVLAVLAVATLHPKSCNCCVPGFGRLSTAVYDRRCLTSHQVMDLIDPRSMFSS